MFSRYQKVNGIVQIIGGEIQISTENISSKRCVIHSVPRSFMLCVFGSLCHKKATGKLEEREQQNASGA